MTKNIQLTTTIPPECANMRLDKALAQLFPAHSRARIQGWIKKGQVTVDGETLRAKDDVLYGQAIVIDADMPDPSNWQAEDIPLAVIYEDDTLMVINKPANMVVHPASGNETGTLVGAILNHAPDCTHLPRAGVIHRIDKDTTGLLVVPKTLTAHTHLIEQLQNRTMKREYLALVQGHIIAGASIDQPIGRHPHHRVKMAVVADGKPAITHYRIEKKYRDFTLLRVQLETGRTHQIRVHMAYIKHPIVGDQTYAGRFAVPAGLSPEFREELQQFKRQALHAASLTLQHPETQESMTFTTPLPDDYATLLTQLEGEDNQQG